MHDNTKGDAMSGSKKALNKDDGVGSCAGSYKAATLVMTEQHTSVYPTIGACCHLTLPPQTHTNPLQGLHPAFHKLK
jgi:hypothetical protein